MYHVGGITLDNHRTFIWYNTGDTIDTSTKMWAPGEPNNWRSMEENCVAMDPRPSQGRDGQLNDLPCTERKGYICEMEDIEMATNEINQEPQVRG